MRKTARLTILQTVILFLCLAGSAQAEIKRIAIGLYTTDALKPAAYWNATASVLTEKIPGYLFTLREYKSPQLLRSAVKKREVDFVITDPVNYIALAVTHRASAIATHVRTLHDKETRLTGVVTFTRASHKSIHQLSDLQNRRFIAFSVNKSIAWWIQLLALRQHDINPYTDFKTMRSDTNQENIVFDVVSGKYDAGAVEPGILETLQANGKLDMTKIRIINQQLHPGYPFRISSALYPDWVFAAAAHTDKQLARQVTRSLLEPADQENKTALSWSVPVSYFPVQALMQRLNLPPYQDFNQVKLSRIITRYWYLAALLLLAMTAAFFFGVKTRRLSHQLNETALALDEADRRIEDIILHDTLTHLSNRRVLDQDLAQEWWRACRQQLPVSAIILDIDNFNEYNNQHGHVAGDQCLIKVADIIKDMFKRSFDITARYGDDEFLVVLPDTNITQCRKLAQTLHQAISALNISTSIGIATLTPTQGSVPDALIAAADAALHDSKKNGTNLITSAPLTG